MSGAQGGCYGGEGGRGTTLSKTLWLKDGVTVKYKTYASPGTYETSGDVLTIHGGNSSYLYFDDVLQAKAGGGQGLITNFTAPTGVNQIYLYGGDDLLILRSTEVHWHGSCYTYQKCGQICECTKGPDENGDYKCLNHRHFCSHCGGRIGSGGSSHYHWICALNCTEGQIIGLTNTAPIATSTDNWHSDSAEVDNIGAGKFTIQLVEQNRLDWSGSNVKAPLYQNVPLHLVVMEYLSGEHYVAYCKHGN